jgi:hypothetical protein
MTLRGSYFKLYFVDVPRRAITASTFAHRVRDLFQKILLFGHGVMKWSNGSQSAGLLLECLFAWVAVWMLKMM